LGKVVDVAAKKEKMCKMVYASSANPIYIILIGAIPFLKYLIQFLLVFAPQRGKITGLRLVVQKVRKDLPENAR
jgi:hypothetical protein